MKVNLFFLYLIIKFCSLILIFLSFSNFVFSSCLNINSSLELNEKILFSNNNDVLIVNSGVYVGNFAINSSIKIIGDGNVLFLSNKNKNILDIVSSDVSVSNIIFYNSGKDMFLKDSCLFVKNKNNNIIIYKNYFSECGFGVWSDCSSYNYISENIFIGTVDNFSSDRGNSIHLFRNNGTVVSNNFIINGRDGVYISNSKEVSINNNVFVNTRFAVHYMFSHKCNIFSNSMIKSLVGSAVMYSKYVDLFNNFVFLNISHGLFFRDVLFSRILKNKSLYNSDGLFIGSSYYNDIINNDIVKNFVGTKISNGSNENLVYDNNFIINKLQVKFLDNKTIIWNSNKIGNFWSHYVGWDINMDNIGDKKFYVTNISNWLIFSYPIIRLIFNSPSLVLLQKIENQFPALRKASIVDNYPLMSPVLW